MKTKLQWKMLLNEKRLRDSGTKGYGVRNSFESDYGRVIYSPAIRRMHDKTQVFPLSDDDNIHTRLTHSQEVMSIGYTFGIKLIEEIFNKQNTKIKEEDFSFLEKKGENLNATLLRTIPVILQTSCLFHDIGNTPFGHFGEDTISKYFENLFQSDYLINEEMKIDFTEYDGNAQGLRVLTKLQILDDIYGLNLTSATLATYIKYPNKKEKEDGSTIANKKHGIFYSEYQYFEEIMNNCGLKHSDTYLRHPLCYLMEASDTIAYRTMDVEDGFNKGLYKIECIFKAIKENIIDKDFLSELKKIESLKTNEKTKMVRLRIFLIDYLVTASFDIFMNNYDAIMNGLYQKELLDDEPFSIEKKLEKICTKAIYPSDEVNSMEVTGYSVIKGLLDFYIKAIIKKEDGLERKAYNLISKSIINAAIFDDKVKNGLLESTQYDISIFNFKDFQNLDEYFKFRVIVDFISGMTDKFALKHFQKISGQRIF
ncbi:MAG: dNTP triphosphohydrolase [Flavobacteriaceae bacterium]|nr:dNTP triphosphohydrolase [Flavobacteriaceae bacterium]